MTRIREWAAVGGVCVPPLFIVVVTALTFANRSFLEWKGWSPLHRTKVEWPSLLELGPRGYVFVVTLVVCGVLVVGTGVAMLAYESAGAAKLAGVGVVISGLAVALEGFHPDDPASRIDSWHNTVHNAVYPLIPLGAVLACVAVSFGGAATKWLLTRRLSGAALAVIVGAIVASLFYDVAQLSRYFLFGAMLVWFEVLAIDLLAGRRSSGNVP